MKLKLSPAVLLFIISVTFSLSQVEGVIPPRCDRYKLPGCPRDFNPVCGTDGKTYSNECMLCFFNKENNKKTEIKYMNEC